MNRKIPSFTLTLVLILLVSFAKYTYSSRRTLALVQTNKRTDTLYARCPVPRDPFYNSQYNDSLSFGRTQTNNSLQWDGNAFIYDLITNDTEGAKTQFNRTLSNTIIYFIFLLIGLAIIILIGPFLLCCCCCPNSCPPSKCCRQPEGKQYTQCQMKWPAVIFMILCLISIGVMVGVIIQNSSFVKGYQDTRCSIAMLFDDLLNGNFTRNRSQYFIGLQPLKISLNTSLQRVSNGSPISSSNQNNQILEKSINQQINDIERDLSSFISDNPSSKIQLNYVSPINYKHSSESQSTNHIQSTFPSVLGNIQEPQTLVGKLYNFISQIKNYLGQFSSKQQSNTPRLLFQQFSSLFVNGKLTTVVAALQKYAGLADFVKQKDVQTDQKLQQVKDKYINAVILAIYIIAGVVIVFSALAFISACAICVGKIFSCRNLLYIFCFILTIAGILCFVLAIATSLLTAGTHYGCQYIEGGLTSKSEFVYRFGPILGNQLLTQMVAQCTATDSTPIIVNSTLNNNQIDNKNLRDLLTNLHSFNNQFIQTFKAYQATQILDITSVSDINILQKLSNSQNYQCSNSGFSEDSWIPNTKQKKQFVSCKIKQALDATLTSCKSISDFQSRTHGCTGCIDTSSILNQFNSYSQLLSSLNRRYSNPNCVSFNQELANVWNNFYKKKNDVLHPLQNKANEISQRIQNLGSLIEKAYKPEVKQPVRRNLQLLPNNTIITQLSCRVLGEDMILITNTFCTQIFNYSFIMRILTITVSFCLLLMMFLATCLGIRAYRSSHQNYLPNGHTPSHQELYNKDTPEMIRQKN